MALISYLQTTAKSLLRLQGYRFESWPFGNGSITLWRRELRRPNAAPKRIVIVPGYGDTPISWLPTAARLARMPAIREARFREALFSEIVLFEFSGYIGSLNRKRAIDSIQKVLAAVTSLLDDLAPHTLVGQSMGGFLSAYYASELESRRKEPSLKKLALLCPSGMSLGNQTQAAIDKLLAELAQGQVDPFIWSAMGKPPGNPLARIPHAIVAAEFREFLRRPESVSIVTSFEDCHLMNERACRIRTPTQLVWGARDALIPFEASTLWLAELRKGLGNRVVLDTLAQGTHGLHLEEPRLIAQAIAHEIT